MTIPSTVLEDCASCAGEGVLVPDGSSPPHFEQHEYGSVMLPLLAPRRLDPVLVDTLQQVFEKAATFEDTGHGQDMVLKKITVRPFYNTSPLTMTSMLADDTNVAPQLCSDIHGLSRSAAEVIEAHNFEARSPGWTRPGSRTPSSAPFPTSISESARSATTRWATSSRTCSGEPTKPSHWADIAHAVLRFTGSGPRRLRT